MLVCPVCRTSMTPYSTNKGDVFVCPRCGSRAAYLTSLRGEAAPRRVREFVKTLLSQVRTHKFKRGRHCPHCNEAMLSAPVEGNVPVWLDVCTRCGVVFFDPGEFEQLQDHARPPAVAPPAKRGPGVPPPLPGEALEEESGFGVQRPTSPWQYIPALLGLPVELSSDRTIRRPYVTYMLTLAMSLVFVVLVATQSLEQAVNDWGFIPNLWDRYGGMTLLTCFFLHAGFFHVISNAYFLMVFGNNVENHLGILGYVFLLLFAHLAGITIDAAFGSPVHQAQALVGASAGISGVIGYYAIAFPKAQIGVMPSAIFVFIGMIRMPAIAALLFYVALQLIGAWAEIGGFTGVAHIAHLGGLAVGVIFGVVMRAMGPRLQMQAIGA